MNLNQSLVVISCIKLYKIIANRIKLVLIEVVIPSQNAFVPERHNQDNLLLAHEMVRGSGRKHGAKKCTLKVEIEGAYDSVN